MGTPVLILLVAAGGALGTWLRFLVAGAVHARTGAAFPWGTLVVNVSGSFALGLALPFLLAAPTDTGAPLRALLAVGCLGAFTTYSTFAWEAAMLVADGQRRRAAAYALASVGLGLVAVAAGHALAGHFL